jgi:hypothetical protein
MATIVGTVGRERHTHWEVRTRPTRPRDVETVAITVSPLEWLEGRDGSVIAIPPTAPTTVPPNRGRDETPWPSETTPTQQQTQPSPAGGGGVLLTLALFFVLSARAGR